MKMLRTVVGLRRNDGGCVESTEITIIVAAQAGTD